MKNYISCFIVLSSLLSACNKTPDEELLNYNTEQAIILTINDTLNNYVGIDSVLYKGEIKTTMFRYTLFTRSDYLKLNTVNDLSTYYIYTRKKTDTLMVTSNRIILPNGNVRDVIPYKATSTFYKFIIDTPGFYYFEAIQK